ncbi:Lipopolysaccharide core heptose(I) kinase RfaP [Gemmata obscuriglobus]|uniref:Lipopolysaccharide kinase n=1 Tax=Gemmata obscuriglobus TaxID=114 RepID=A0A2Z3GW36_9BACT|nr:lipopolysaccharide kinase InaA family protein [Gemmata obscuriglobus]AWM37538.1 lipopolysaccharide kinase [Gemmata obscuriglobus]QEG29678.1 Lipopolysaccharide core heptose(I) kinase RfaP [Gemmata obscuriglobus]VTS08995.1 heptose kinase : Lipopolysaccharide kinase (Kdo/WaaP) family OS=Singulisphaera acidiphila (strain ATCC BAA-1392 / DSM 18658 / VKM B-2454 / MOB10) GN=Sinac_3096 PE=4 SV=1: Kdo [Gemmata obscuriglobus UQM 2246]
MSANPNPSLFRPEVGDPVSSFWRRVRQGVRLLRRQADWERFAGESWTESIMTVPLTDREHSKQGRSIGRKVFADGRDKLSVYLKRHYRLPRLHGLLATLFPGRAWSPGLQEWAHLCWAKEHGFPVPRPVAAGQFVGPWGRLQGFLAVEELHGMLPLHEAVPRAARTLDPRTFARWKRGLVAELARLSRELHRRHVFHKDLYFCHFYIPEALARTPPSGWTNRVVMIDLHRLARHPLTGPWWQIKDLAQLLFSSEVEGVTARDRVRFWKLYRRHWPAGRAPGEWIRPLVKWKWQRYRRHNQRKPSAVPYDQQRSAA